MGQQFAPADHLQSRPSVQDDVTEITGYAYDTVCGDAWVAREFEFLRRRKNSGIPFAIFQELAPHEIGHPAWIS